MDRRELLTLGAAAILSLPAAPALAQAASRYDATIRTGNVPRELQPRMVRNKRRFKPYELHIIPREFALYWTQPNGRALRYSVGIGRRGLYESGEFYVGAKKVWPSWTPTKSMIARQPHIYKKHAGGMPGGPDNPLGARALYLFQPGRGDTFLRIHGTNSPKTIGRRVSNGCARLVNAHMVDLYQRVPMGTRVVLHPVSA